MCSWVRRVNLIGVGANPAAGVVVSTFDRPKSGAAKREGGRGWIIKGAGVGAKIRRWRD